MGEGWWAWFIPLKGGDVSIGVVFDQRLVQWSAEGSLGQRLKVFLCAHPVGLALLRNAQWIEGDVHWRKNLSYSSTTLAGDGFALVGDAAGFLDPLYSPGLDWVSYTATAASQLILANLRGVEMAARVKEHNRVFRQSFERWFSALYKDKYEYLGEFDLMRLGFLMDLGLYYLGVASQPFLHGPKRLSVPVFSTAPSIPFFYFMRAYNRRFAAIARSRRARGALGRLNDRRQYLFDGFTFEKASGGRVVMAALQWMCLELKEGWRSWFAVEKNGQTSPAPVAAEPSKNPD